MVIGLDFDGTCVTHDFPRIGKDIGSVPVLKELVRSGHKLIIWTMRSDKTNKKYLTDAINWFNVNGIPLYGIQTNPGQEKWTDSPKAHCDLYIDDLGLGIPLKYDKRLSQHYFVDWIKVRQMLKQKNIL